MEREKIKKAKRIVLKVGTTSLIYENGNLNFERIEKISQVLSDVFNSGKEVILVTSGAIGVGRKKMHFDAKPQSVQEKQACASVGQVVLMQIYSKMFGEYGYSVGQILLTKDVVENPRSKENVRNTFETLLQHRIIPIVNENDSVSIDEIKNISRFGDNDSLAAVVALIVEADLLIILSDIDGFYNKNPKIYKDAVLLDCVKEITEDIKKAAEGSGSDFGTGGMRTKIEAAQMVVNHGCDMILTSSENPKAVLEILKGAPVGTLFVAKDK